MEEEACPPDPKPKTTTTKNNPRSQSELTKSMQKRLKKYQAQAAKMHATGNSTVLTNELNANLANWEKYATEWNAMKKNKANST